MKQQVAALISDGRGGRVYSPSASPAATRMRVTSRAAPPAMTPAPGPTRTTHTTMAAAAAAAAARRQQRAVPTAVLERRVSTKKEETIEEEVVRLRAEVGTLQREVQRLLRLNADLQEGLSKTISSSDDLSKQEQANNDAATNSTPKPPTGPLPPTKEIPRVAARPPPPPPPPPRQQKKQEPSLVNKATAVLDTYNSLLTNKPRQHRKNDRSNHHSDIVGELQNRSMHILSIKADVETKAEFINGLIKKVHTSSYADAEQVLTFVDWLDQQLSTLSDETAVLKHFNWPERKADALREAASEYRHLKHLLTDISSFNDDDDGTSTTCEATLRKISGLLAKLEKNMNRLVNLRSTVMPSYKELRIPTDWMHDSGMALKMRLASVSLAKKYMKKVLKELENRDTAANEASLLAQSVRFTYRVHQFAGGLDCEAMHSFEELRRRVQLVSSP